MSLRPIDPLAKKMASTGVETRNVLVKVTLPKRTGRKRKRGSDEPFTSPTQAEPESNLLTAQELLDRLRDNQHSYQIEAVGLVNATHRFRTPPDFQMRVSDLPIMQELKTQVIMPDYDRLKDFYIDRTPGLHGVTTFPAPPDFVQGQPFRYDYSQVEGLVWRTDGTGKEIPQNTGIVLKRLLEPLTVDAKEVPVRPPQGLQMRGNYQQVQDAAMRLQQLLDKRPMMTKRAAMNQLPGVSESTYKDAAEFVGYSFKGGPFRDLLIRFGIDPRSDPAYRHFQVLAFQMDKVLSVPGTDLKTLWTSQGKDSHVFDGTKAYTIGKLWQVCDLIDPLLRDILDTDDIRPDCDIHQWGWYWSGTLAKARTIMRDKMRCLLAGQAQPDDQYRVVMTMPNRIGKQKDGRPNAVKLLEDKTVARLSQEVRYLACSGFTTKRMNGVKAADEDDVGQVDEGNGERNEDERSPAAGAEAGVEARDADGEGDYVQRNGDFEEREGVEDEAEID